LGAQELLRRKVSLNAAAPKSTSATLATRVTGKMYDGPPVLESAEAEAVALAVAVALGLTLAAAEMVTAAVVPAVAVTLSVLDAVAEALPLDVCASAADANSATMATGASIMAAHHSGGAFFLNSTSASSQSGTTR
jgi:hypothetical protein